MPYKRVDDIAKCDQGFGEECKGTFRVEPGRLGSVALWQGTSSQEKAVTVERDARTSVLAKSGLQ